MTFHEDGWIYLLPLPEGPPCGAQVAGSSDSDCRSLGVTRPCSCELLTRGHGRVRGRREEGTWASTTCPQQRGSVKVRPGVRAAPGSPH